MTSDGIALRHNALVYESHDEYVVRAVPFLKEGLAAGEGAIVAHTKPGIALMREALEADAAHVTLSMSARPIHDPREPGCIPPGVHRTAAEDA